MGAKRAKNLKISVDVISELPDEILSFTLSFLPLREAARTSILSRRWRNFWKESVIFYHSLSLDLLAMKGSSYSTKIFGYHVNCILKRRNKLLQTERSKFIEWVNQILQLDYSPTIDSFRLRFYMKKNYAHVIDKWISVAIAKRVRNFDIDLSHFHCWGKSSRFKGLYTFPYWLFTKKTGSLMKCLYLTSCNLGPIDFHCFSSLIDIQLENVPIERDDVAKVLSSCPNLEKLCLAECHKLRSFRISGPSLKMSCLILSRCHSVNKVEIDARNLTRFDYCGGPIKFSFVNVPHLSNLTINNLPFDFSATISYALRKLSSDLPNLEYLFLSVETIEENKIPRCSPLFLNLKTLVVKVYKMEIVLWDLIPLFLATPYLQRLELHLFNSAKECEEVQRLSNSPHLHLKEIVLSGFRATSHEIEFVTYLLNNSPVLDKLTINYESIHYDYKLGFHTGVSSEVFFGYSKDIIETRAAEAACKREEMVKRASLQLGNVLRPDMRLQFV